MRNSVKIGLTWRVYAISKLSSLMPPFFWVIQHAKPKSAALLRMYWYLHKLQMLLLTGKNIHFSVMKFCFIGYQSRIFLPAAVTLPRATNAKTRSEPSNKDKTAIATKLEIWFEFRWIVLSSQRMKKYII